MPKVQDEEDEAAMVHQSRLCEWHSILQQVRAEVQGVFANQAARKLLRKSMERLQAQRQPAHMSGV